VEKYFIAGQATDDNRRMRIACWIIKSPDTNSENATATYCCSTATMVARTRLNVALYIIACLVFIVGGSYKRYWKQLPPPDKTTLN